MPQRDPVLKLLLVWVTLLTTVVWLPVVRGVLNGPSYAWALGDLGGNGTGGDYWMLLIALAVVLVLQLSGRRGPRPLFPILLLPLLIAADVAIIGQGVSDPEGLRFRGDTLGIDISMGYILVAVFTLFVFIAILWTVRRVRERRFLHADPPWVRRNCILLIIAALIVPVQYLTFRHGGESAEQIGVVATILQWFVFNAGLTAPTERLAPPAIPEPFPPP